MSPLLQIDGSRYSGSGTIVRQAVMLSALTGQPVHIVNARANRPNPGLRAQHIRVVEAVCELVNGEAEGLVTGSKELVFRPGTRGVGKAEYDWDIGSAGSTTMLALAVLPLLAFGERRIGITLHGGLFQDFAPSVYHLQFAVLPLLREMGMEVQIVMVRPGYVPTGQGVLRSIIHPRQGRLRAIRRDRTGSVTRVWGIALASHLEERSVCERMAKAAAKVLGQAGYRPQIELQKDATALQPGAGLALFGDLAEGSRLGADRAGALRRPAEAIGKHAAAQLIEEILSGATLDRFVADQIVPFAALADGESRFRVARETDHLRTNGWLVEQFLGAKVTVQGGELAIQGAGYAPTA